MSDHIPDVTKMIGETPRTDKNRQCFFCSISGLRDPSHDYVEIEFSRQLERELNVANERIKNLESALSTVENIDKVNAYQDLESANERIKRLEEAGDLMVQHFYTDEPRSEMWEKAKEAKP